MNKIVHKAYYKSAFNSKKNHNVRIPKRFCSINYLASAFNDLYMQSTEYILPIH